MLIEKKNIDYLFREKLQNYESKPPVFLWNQIEKGLNARSRRRKIMLFNATGIAAAVLVAFLTGWWLNNSVDFIQNQITESVISHEEPMDIITESHPIASLASSEQEKDKTVRKSFNPSVSSIASFATDVSFLQNEVNNSSEEKGEVVLLDIEKEFLSQFQTEKKFLKKITGLLSGDKINNPDKINDNTNFVKSVTFVETAKLNQVTSKVIPVNSEEYREKNKASWSLSMVATPLFTWGIDNNAGQRTSAENTISGGILAGVNLGKRVAVKSGILFSQLKQKTSNVGLPSSENLAGFGTLRTMTPSGPVILDHPTTADSNFGANGNFPLEGFQLNLGQEFNYIEIPVLATYKVIDRRFSVGLTGGVSSNILSRNSAYISENGKSIKIGETAGLRDVTYSGLVGLSVGYDIGNGISLIVEPRIKQYFNSLSSNAAINFRPSQIGVFTGLTYSFN